MKLAQWRTAVLALAASGIAVTPAVAQQGTMLPPDQQMILLQQQLAASQATALRLEQRLDALERQLQQLVNQGEVSIHRVSQLESAVANLRNDMNARSIAAPLPSAPEKLAGAAVPAEQTIEAPKPAMASASLPPIPPKSSVREAAQSDPAEDAYSEGFHLWDGGKYDQAITSLRSFTSAFPKHRRVSFANNLIGRALIEKGQPRAAAEALLANYRANPKGERAADSLYYLGQALMKLNQAGQACKAYAELEDVYGASLRADLKSLVTKGKADAGCS